jgi:hypothetical protein
MSASLSTTNFTSLNEDAFREVMQYLSKKEVARIRQVNKQCNIFAGAHLLSGIMRANRLLEEEWQILKPMLPASTMQHDALQFFLSHRFTVLRDGIEHLFDAYKKYVGKDVYPVIPARVFINIRIYL